jgi:hypothetical protein
MLECHLVERLVEAKSTMALSLAPLKHAIGREDDGRIPMAVARRRKAGSKLISNHVILSPFRPPVPLTGCRAGVKWQIG